MACVTEQVAEYVASAATIDEAKERIIELLAGMSRPCLMEVQKATSVSEAHLYGIRARRLPFADQTFRALLPYFAPGYSLRLVPTVTRSANKDRLQEAARIAAKEATEHAARLNELVRELAAA